MGRSYLLALDESPVSKNAALWCCNNVVRPDDAVHLVAVTSPPTYSVAPAAPIATAGAVAALSLNWEAQRKAEEERAKELLREVTEELATSKVDRQQIQAHLLPAAGGASGVAESLVTYAKERHIDMLVLGSRGMGAVKSALMSLVGLGSVSDYCLHNLHAAVAVVRGRPADAQAAGPGRKVLVALDESDLSKAAEVWAVQGLLRPDDELHLVSVALPVPYQIAEEDSIAAHVLETDEATRAAEDSMGFADEVARLAVDAAVQEGVDRSRIFFKALRPEGGASDVGESIVHYARDNGIGLVVVGSRGMGSLRRALMNFVGLGSVSDYVVHHLECPVIVYKE